MTMYDPTNQPDPDHCTQHPDKDCCRFRAYGPDRRRIHSGTDVRTNTNNSDSQGRGIVCLPWRSGESSDKITSTPGDRVYSEQHGVCVHQSPV